MHLVDDWRFVLFRSHSMWAFVLGVLAFNAPDAIYLIGGVDTDAAIWSMIGNMLFAYGIAGRLIRQVPGARNIAMPLVMILAALATLLLMGMGQVPDDPPDPGQARAPTEAQTMAVAVPLVAKWEGLRPEAYLDTIASPPVWTVCYGETEGVTPGEVRTVAQCEDGLRRGLVRYRDGLHRYFEGRTLQRYLTPERDAAFVSLAYNVGIAGAGGSTAVRRLNGGDIAGACAAIGWWNKAGGRVVRGLVNRRADETALCLRGAVG